MATTLQEEILGVRVMLNNPLPQSPSFQDILEELEAEYTTLTNTTNATGNAWQVDNYTLTTVAGTYDYAITPVAPAGDFFKALNVTTIPEDVDTSPQYMLEFTELEHIPNEWAWLGESRGQFMYSSHDSQIIAFYRKITSAGESLRCQIRPTPTQVQTYNILYQVSDWWSLIDDSLGLAFTMPHSSQKFYLRALVAQNLLMKGNVSWSFDAVENYKMSNLVAKGLEMRLERYRQVFEEYRGTLDNPDLTEISSWAEENVWQ